MTQTTRLWELSEEIKELEDAIAFEYRRSLLERLSKRTNTNKANADTAANDYSNDYFAVSI